MKTQIRLAEMIASLANNTYVEPSKTTVADFVLARMDQWEAAGGISARTALRYQELVANQIAPFLGDRHCKNFAPLISRNGIRHSG